MFNPYQNPYQPNTQYYPQYMQMPQNSKQDIIKVHGVEGANAYQLAPNSSVLLLDDSAPIVWLKQSDGAGYCTVTPYTITPYKQEPDNNLQMLEQRIKALEDKMNESNITSVKSNDKTTKLHD